MKSCNQKTGGADLQSGRCRCRVSPNEAVEQHVCSRVGEGVRCIGQFGEIFRRGDVAGVGSSDRLVLEYYFASSGSRFRAALFQHQWSCLYRSKRSCTGVQGFEPRLLEEARAQTKHRFSSRVEKNHSFDRQSNLVEFMGEYHPNCPIAITSAGVR